MADWNAAMNLLCMILKHQRDASRVWDDGHNYRAPCRRCGFPLIKVTFGDWRAFDATRDYEADGAPRKSRPLSR
ncbi:hypothetical protein G4G27_07825 [Sphingomonas sp. So64.6b]|uniref:hypothetical protein n=1 Tax=Sphingomonas sp. So64.6b TaxID=2997354 RepID=UPI00160319E6|nr:hypothetical protein [Sphingomonas sp. So64.6b]QNA83905.1 hypothetical protein G4G27_07825 [Sphingomonas sp. So64.6b]